MCSFVAGQKQYREAVEFFFLKMGFLNDGVTQSHPVNIIPPIKPKSE